MKEKLKEILNPIADGAMSVAPAIVLGNAILTAGATRKNPTRFGTFLIELASCGVALVTSHYCSERIFDLEVNQDIGTPKFQLVTIHPEKEETPEKET